MYLLSNVTALRDILFIEGDRTLKSIRMQFCRKQLVSISCICC